MRQLFVALVSLLALPCPPVTAALDSYFVEAEDLLPQGEVPVSQAENGRKFVRFGDAEDSSLTWKLTTPEAGIYRLTAMVATPMGLKGYAVEVNGAVTNTGYFGPGTLRPAGAFGQRSCGLVELRAGENIIQLKRGWGYWDVDFLGLEPVQPPSAPQAPSRALCDPLAGVETQALFAKLHVSYGQGMISGIYRGYGHEDWHEADNVEARTGQRPTIYGVDLMPFSPMWVAREGRPMALVEDAIAAGKAGHPLVLMWHWAVPVPEGKPYYKGFEKFEGGFDIAEAVRDNTPEYKQVLADLDALAAELKRFQDANLPVIWRPLHEPEGAWFWWGAKDAQTYIKLWRLMHERFTKTHKLHNLIWMYSAADQLDLDWYPGDDVVDIVSVDLYPGDSRDNHTIPWERLYNRFGGKKLIALGEVGGVPDIARLQRLGVHWSFFLSWPEKLGPAGMEDAPLRERYQDPRMINFAKWQK